MVTLRVTMGSRSDPGAGSLSGQWPGLGGLYGFAHLLTIDDSYGLTPLR